MRDCRIHVIVRSYKKKYEKGKWRESMNNGRTRKENGMICRSSCLSDYTMCVGSKKLSDKGIRRRS